MTSPTPNSRPNSRPESRSKSSSRSRVDSRPEPLKPSRKSAGRTPPGTSGAPDVVDPIWLLKAVGGTLLAALVCGYLALCLLFYQGQWQFVLHPSRATPAPAAIAGVPFQSVRFGVDETASPQLTGWLIPASPGARYSLFTVLYMPSGDGSLADAIPTLSALHDTGINVFAFDYRGYGQSAPGRPNQRRMTEDAASAWQYVTVSRAVAPSRIVLFGDGVGCALAAQLAAEHLEAPAVILQSPRPEIIRIVLADPRTRSLPVRALFHQNFEITAALASLKTPKLFLLEPEERPSDATAAEIRRLTSTASTPKIISDLRAGEFNGPLYREQIARFLDQYLR